jgi:hypothetical protein
VRGYLRNVVGNAGVAKLADQANGLKGETHNFVEVVEWVTKAVMGRKVNRQISGPTLTFRQATANQ